MQHVIVWDRKQQLRAYHRGEFYGIPLIFSISDIGQVPELHYESISFLNSLMNSVQMLLNLHKYL
jgi:hypothetical protein